MTVRALFSMGVNVLGGIYIRLITRVSVRYGEIFHEPKASEISRHISQLTSVISDLFLQCTTYVTTNKSRSVYSHHINIHP